MTHGLAIPRRPNLGRQPFEYSVVIAGWISVGIIHPTAHDSGGGFFLI
jgi:hypothetical protein